MPTKPELFADFQLAITDAQWWISYAQSRQNLSRRVYSGIPGKLAFLQRIFPSLDGRLNKQELIDDALRMARDHIVRAQKIRERLPYSVTSEQLTAFNG